MDDTRGRERVCTGISVGSTASEGGDDGYDGGDDGGYELLMRLHLALEHATRESLRDPGKAHELA